MCNIIMGCLTTDVVYYTRLSQWIGMYDMDLVIGMRNGVNIIMYKLYNKQLLVAIITVMCTQCVREAIHKHDQIQAHFFAKVLYISNRNTY